MKQPVIIVGSIVYCCPGISAYSEPSILWSPKMSQNSGSIQEVAVQGSGCK